MSKVAVLVCVGDDNGDLIDLEGADLEAAVDEDIAEFDRYFQQALKNEPLVFSERAILKTYLHWKTHQETTDASDPSSEI